MDGGQHPLPWIPLEVVLVTFEALSDRRHSEDWLVEVTVIELEHFLVKPIGTGVLAKDRLGFGANVHLLGLGSFTYQASLAYGLADESEPRLGLSDEPDRHPARVDSDLELQLLSSLEPKLLLVQCLLELLIELQPEFCSSQGVVLVSQPT
mmetsp:Transcript_40738/g.62182  ORF Transcript_40738/g.62182 Transcript_40738/m.62182 type:complete len:151 (+) Transcript_40738:1698-2150(+)